MKNASAVEARPGQLFGYFGLEDGVGLRPEMRAAGQEMNAAHHE